MGKDKSMKLEHDVLNRHFEKSERMNLLQQRIKSYCSLIQERYNDQGFEVTKNIPMMQRWEARGLEQAKRSQIPIGDAVLEFYCGINSDVPSVSQQCGFHLTVGEKGYDLTKDNLPARYIELVYESLPQLTDLMQTSGDPLALTIADEVTKEILAYLR